MSEFYPSSSSEYEYEDNNIEFFDQNPDLQFLTTVVRNKPGYFETLASARDNIIKEVNVDKIVLHYLEGETREIIQITISTLDEKEAVKAIIMLVNKCEKLFRKDQYLIVADDEHINPFPTTITTIKELEAHPHPMHWIYIAWDE